MTRPGDRLRRWAASWCGPETMERLVDPILADLQAESGDAGAGGWRRRGAVWRGYLAFWKALALHGVMQTFRPRAASEVRPRSVLAYSAIAFAVMTTAMVAPPMIAFVPVGSPLERMWLMALLVPQSLPLSIPMGVSVGTVCAMRGRQATGRHVAAVLTIAAVATFAVWTMLEWGVPSANQEFRETIATHLNGGRRVELEPGLNELGLSRLAQRTDARAQQAYRLFWAICFATPAFAVFALGIAVRVRGFVAALFLSFATIVSYWLFLMVVDEPFRAGMLSTIVVWLPNVTFLAVGALMLRATDFRLKPSLDGARDGPEPVEGPEATH